jgi:hypothetical protein
LICASLASSRRPTLRLLNSLTFLFHLRIRARMVARRGVPAPANANV